MPLPFTRDQFLGVFGSYNESLWPFVLALWLVSFAALICFVRDPGRCRFINVILVTQWLWSAIAYHAAFFARINPAAWLFAGLFLTQALLFFSYGKRLSYPQGRSLHQLFATAHVN